MTGDERWTDYIVEVDVYNHTFAYPVRIIIRVNRGNYLVFQTNCCKTEWILITGGSEKVIATLDEGGLSFSPRRVYAKNSFRIEAIGQTFNAYIDGVSFLQVTDPSLSSGKVGLGFQYPYNETPRFENFRVSAP